MLRGAARRDAASLVAAQPPPSSSAVVVGDEPSAKSMRHTPSQPLMLPLGAPAHHTLVFVTSAGAAGTMGSSDTCHKGAPLDPASASSAHAVSSPVAKMT